MMLTTPMLHHQKVTSKNLAMRAGQLSRGLSVLSPKPPVSQRKRLLSKLIPDDADSGGELNLRERITDTRFGNENQTKEK